MKNISLDLSDLFSRGLRAIGAGTALALLLLLLSMGSVAYGLTLVVRSLSAGYALWVAASGLLAGWLLARSRLSAWRSGLWGSLLGLAMLLVQLGGLAASLFAFLMQANALALAFFQGPWGNPTLLENARVMGLVLGQLLERLGVLLERLAAYFVTLLSGSPAFDPLAILIVWGMALWFTSTWAAWQVRRSEKPLAALLPGGVLLSACLSYSRGNPSILLPYLAAALLLVLLVEHQCLRRGWEASNTDYSDELGLDIAILAVPLVAMILAAAAFSPDISPRRINQLIQEAVRQPNSPIGELGDSLGLRRAPAIENRLENQRSPGMPRQHLLGSGPELSEETVMAVRTLEIGDPRDEAGLPERRAARLNYWRWLTYDIYTGSGWTTNRSEAVSYRPGEPARPPGEVSDTILEAGLAHHLRLTQDIEILSPSKGALYVVGTILSTDAGYQLAWRPSSEQAGADIFGGWIESSHYQVHSLVSTPIERQLLASGSLYPEEIRGRYLALPDSLPARVHALALELTATLPNPYERARAIESYLRSLPYSLDVPLPPRDSDAIDYYLFDLKRGYCDYAASAMVVLARAAGIPARLVIGYAGGSFDPARGALIVTEADAHSWAELYFPGSGWVEFEPTSGRPELEYDPEFGPPIQASLDRHENRPSGWPSWPILTIVILVALALFISGWHIGDRYRLRKMAPESTVLMVYERFYHGGSQLISGSTPAHTPNEFADRITCWMEGLVASSRWGKRLAIHPPEINRLTRLYNQTAYSSHRPGRSEQALVIQAWDRIGWRLWLLRLSPGQLSKPRA